MAMTPHASTTASSSSHRAISPRIAELPSLRYGSIGATCTRSGPLKVGGGTTSTSRYTTSDSTTTTGLVNRYRRSMTSPDVVATINKPTRTTTRHVRFDIPSSASLTSTESRDGGVETSSSSVRSVVGSRQHRYTAQRHHTTGKYVKGTLSPTSSNAVVARPGASTTGTSGITGTPRPPIPPSSSDHKHTSAYKSLVSRFSVTPTHKKYQHGDLLRAARETDETAIRELLKRAVVVGVPESELNSVDATGRTPVSYIASNGSVDILEAILQIPGVDINKPDNEGNTPLHFAAQAGQVECLNYLLSRCQSIEIDARNDLGFTPLMKAALQGRNKCAKLLLFAGASPTARDSGRGLRPDQWARYCGRYVCADVIEKFSKTRTAHSTLPSAAGGDKDRTNAGLVHGTGPKWGSDTDLATKLTSPATRSHSTAGGIKSKFRWIFGTSASYPSKGYTGGTSPGSASRSVYTDESSSTRLVSQLTAAAICASSPLLPTNAATSSSPSVKSLVRPLSVPKLHVTLANPAAAPANADNFIPNNIPTGSYYDDAAKKGTLFHKKKK